MANMILTLADKTGKEICELIDVTLDAEINGEKTFELSVKAGSSFNRMEVDQRIYFPGTEIGGVIKGVETDTSTGLVTYDGFMWRGLMSKKIIEPPTGSDYYIANGELNEILRNLIEPMFGGTIIVPHINTGVIISNYKFDRYCTLLDGCEKLLKSIGYRLNIIYNPGEPNGCGWVEISAEKIKDRSNEIELSQDSQLNFKMYRNEKTITHLIVLGKGELQERTVIHLYLQKDGTIGHDRYYQGIDNLEEIYENTSAETEELEKLGKEKFRELIGQSTFEMDVQKMGIDVPIGDIVGGRDYITGMEMAAPIGNIVIKMQNGIITKDYKLEE